MVLAVVFNAEVAEGAEIAEKNSKIAKKAVN